MQIDKFLISENATLRDALSHIELNHHGIVMAVDVLGRVTGLATDGDIRRELLNGRTLDDRISTCINAEFIFEDPATPREALLKKLDQRIRVIPLLDADRRLVGVVSRNHLPVRAEEAVFARARSPVRISFGGGGSPSCCPIAQVEYLTREGKVWSIAEFSDSIGQGYGGTLKGNGPLILSCDALNAAG